MTKHQAASGGGSGPSVRAEIDPPGSIAVEQHGEVLLGRLHGSHYAELVPGIVTDLADLVTRAERDPAVRAVVLTGTHPDRFIAHASVQWLQQGAAHTPDISLRTAAAVTKAARVGRRAAPGLVERTPLKDAAQLDLFHDTLLRMNGCGAIFVAALNGSALGGGCELALACDLRIMAEGPYLFGQPEVIMGIIPGGGGTQRLPRLIGSHQALKHILEAAGMTPGEALANGAVDELVPKAELLDHALRRAAHYGARDKAAVAAAKRAVYFGGSMELKDGLRFERVEFLQILATPRAQQLMLAHEVSTQAHHELPLYRPDVYAAAITSGCLPTNPY